MVNPLQASERAARNLEKVLAVNAQLNSTLNLDELLGVIMNVAAEVMETEATSLMLINETGEELLFRVALGCKANQLKENFTVKMGEGIAGSVAQSGVSVIVNDPLNDARFARRFDQATGFKSKAILCVPMHARDKIIGVLQALNPLKKEPFSGDDLHLFEKFADQAAIAVENARLHEALLKEERTKQDLAIAHEIQQNFLPDLDQNKCGIDIAAKSVPARQVGGDFYDVIKLDEARTSILIGDVSGKGVPAALYMVRAISDYRLLAPHASSAGEILNALNKSLAKDSSFGMFITMLCLIIDTREKTLEFASAGHHPILCSSQGRVQSLDLESSVPVGLSEETSYPQNRMPYQTGDVLFLYTDGVTEARNKKGEEYSLERLKKRSCSCRADAREHAEEILKDLRHFTQDAPVHDDITLLTVMFHD